MEILIYSVCGLCVLAFSLTIIVSLIYFLKYLANGITKEKEKEKDTEERN